MKVHGWNLEFQSNGIGWMGFKLFVQMIKSWLNKHIFLGEIWVLATWHDLYNPEQVACWCSGMKRELAKDIFCQYLPKDIFCQYIHAYILHIQYWDTYIIMGIPCIFVSIYTWTYTDHQEATCLSESYFMAVILLLNWEMNFLRLPRGF